MKKNKINLKLNLKNIKIKYNNLKKYNNFIKIKFKKQINKYLWFDILELENLLLNNELKENYIAGKQINKFKKQDYYLIQIKENNLFIKTNNQGLWTKINFNKDILQNIIKNIKLLKKDYN